MADFRKPTEHRCPDEVEYFCNVFKQPNCPRNQRGGKAATKHAFRLEQFVFGSERLLVRWAQSFGYFMRPAFRNLLNLCPHCIEARSDNRVALRRAEGFTLRVANGSNHDFSASGDRIGCPAEIAVIPASSSAMRRLLPLPLGIAQAEVNNLRVRLSSKLQCAQDFRQAWGTVFSHLVEVQACFWSYGQD